MSCVAKALVKQVSVQQFLQGLPMLKMHAFMVEYNDLDESVHQIECVM